MKNLLKAIYKNFLFIFIAVVLIIGAGFGYLYYRDLETEQKINKVNDKLTDLITKQEELNEKLPAQLFKDHIATIENIGLKEKTAALEEELNSLKRSEDESEIQKAEEIYILYDSYEKKLLRNANLDLDTEEETNEVERWGNLLLEKEFGELTTALNEKITLLDNKYQEYVDTLPPPPSNPGGGYSYTTVTTEKGTFGVYLLKFSKSEVTVKTIAAIEEDCSNNCATKTLQQYVDENNAYAGMTGSYACPADYESCSGKIWSFDFALYDSNDNKWFNKNALTWGETGMITFTGQSSDFYKKTSDYGGGYVTAGVSNFPALLKDGRIVVDSGDTDSYQEVKGLRGVIGVDDNNIYLAYVTGASVIDAAYAIKALGAKHALNLDGGGTAAMYVGGNYVVGPGRPLANAILIIK